MRLIMKRYLSLFLSLCILILTMPSISIAEYVDTPAPDAPADTTPDHTETPAATESPEPTGTPAATESPEPTGTPDAKDASTEARIVALTGAPVELEVEYGLAEDKLELPGTLTAEYSNGTQAEVAVSWYCISDGLGGTTYNGECENYEQALFTFKAQLPVGTL
ncbi:MAG: Ig-like domain-containing protein, partial [Candidatus Fimadaptatus sp.]